jgi:hypothetical protein
VTSDHPASTPTGDTPPERTIRWSEWDGDGIEELTLRFENRGWTAEGRVHGVDVHYVLRLDPHWRVQQLLLFRDMEDPDLWLATDGGGRWGEVNGAHREDLDGCTDIDLTISPFPTNVLLRRLPLRTGHGAEITVAVVDVETLQVRREHRRVERVADARWYVEHRDADGIVLRSVEVEVDEVGDVLDEPGRFRRLG